jgi:two-component system NtrC family sensor kinase
MENKEKMIELLTGVQASKRNYYTELKKTVHELQKKNIQLEIINEVMKSFNVEMSMDDMLRNVLEKLNTIVPIERISLSIMDGTDLILTNVYPPYSFSIEPGSVIIKENSLYWNVLKTGKPCFLSERKPEERTWFEEDSFYRIGIKSLFLFPLLIKGKVTGILSLGSKERVKNDPSDFAFFQQLSDQLAVCLENTRLFNEILNAKKQWEETFQAVSDSIFVTNFDGIIVQSNKTAEQTFPNNGNLVGQRVDHLLFSQNSHPFQQTLQTNTPSSTELHIEKKVYECDCYPILDDFNQLYGAIIYLKNVTAKRKIEGQLIQSGKLAAIGEMAAGVAHELNNPLTAIMGNSQLLLRKINENDSSYQLLKDIYECGKRSKNIIRNLLTFSRQDEYLFEKCSVNEAVHQALSLVGNQLSMQPIHVQTNLDESIPLIEGSCQQIVQIIINLLLNAKDALEDSQQMNKTILVQTAMEMVDGVQKIVLRVVDNGSGMEQSIISEIFHPFYTTKNGAKGNGLGLSVSLGIAESHGGTIRVESVLRKGSTFKLILPIP